jgi:hypothetical protein
VEGHKSLHMFAVTAIWHQVSLSSPQSEPTLFHKPFFGFFGLVSVMSLWPCIEPILGVGGRWQKPLSNPIHLLEVSSPFTSSLITFFISGDQMDSTQWSETAGTGQAPKDEGTMVVKLPQSQCKRY